MKSIRLNKDIRAEIVSNIMQSYSEENKRPEAPKDSNQDLDKAVMDYILKRDIFLAECIMTYLAEALNNGINLTTKAVTKKCLERDGS